MRALLAALLALAGCGRYGEFTLPPPQGEARVGSWVWEQQAEPVIRRGPETHDSVDALNPSVIRKDGEWVNYYSGWDGRVWRTLLAKSRDGLLWTKDQLVVIEPRASTWEGSYIAANGAAFDGGVIYQGGSPPQIGVSTTREIVLPRGPRGAWDEMGVGDPFVVRAGGRLFLYFLGQDRARRQRLGVAESTDNGLTWTKLRTNPILDLGAHGAFDEKGLGEPAVWGQFGKWWMLYTGRDKREWRQIGMAVSADGIHWIRSTASPLIGVGPEGSWNSRVVCDPDVHPLPDASARVYFGGGDKPQPAENLNGQIGVGVLRFKF